ncbi:hypothetical protein QBC39DRAFT_690 [Podospora conica]|nr:hypothetical protein QBC39DRAFT_690 [Schizothecium conicum]
MICMQPPPPNYPRHFLPSAHTSSPSLARPSPGPPTGETQDRESGPRQHHETKTNAQYSRTPPPPHKSIGPKCACIADRVPKEIPPKAQAESPRKEKGVSTLYILRSHSVCCVCVRLSCRRRRLRTSKKPRLNRRFHPGNSHTQITATSVGNLPTQRLITMLRLIISPSLVSQTTHRPRLSIPIPPSCYTPEIKPDRSRKRRRWHLHVDPSATRLDQDSYPRKMRAKKTSMR